jgi:hypothetical protein
MLICLILISVGILKTPVYQTVLATLFVAVIIILCELINGITIGLFMWIRDYSEFSNYDFSQTLKIIFGKPGRVTEFFTNSSEVEKSLAGIPSNILFFVIILIIYRFNNNKRVKVENSGSISGSNS